MSLLVELQSTPNEIFEVVKARILANREKWLRDQQGTQLRGPTRPRVQRTRFNATASTYRRPEPSAQDDGYPVGGFFWEYFFDLNGVIGQFITLRTLGGEQEITMRIDLPYINYPFGSIYAFSTDRKFFVFPVSRYTCLLYFYVSQREVAAFKGAGIIDDRTLLISKTWLFTKSSVREISTPAALVNKLDPFLVKNHEAIVNLIIEPITIDPRPSRIIGNIPSTGANDEEAQIALAAAFPLAVDRDGVIDDLTGNIWLYNIEFWENVGPDPQLIVIDEVWYLTYNLPNTEQKNSDFYSKAFLTNYGGGVGANGLYTPGVFTFINNPDYANWSTDEELEAAYFQNVPVPRNFLMDKYSTFGSEDPNDWQVRFEILSRAENEIYRQNIANENYGYVPITRYNPNGILPYSESGVYAVWDWNQPAYCRQQLLALGFTPEDLTPAPPPPSAP